MTIFLTFVFAGIILGIWQQVKNAKEAKLAKEQFLNLPRSVANFYPEKVYIHTKGLSYIALDHTSKRIILGHRAAKANFKGDFITHRIVNYDDIVRSEIIVDGQTVSSKSAAGALAGGLLFGATGAIVGSNTGKTKYSKNIKSITLKVLVKDVLNPTIELPFYNKSKEVNLPQKAQQDCQNWQDTLTVALS